MQHAKKMILIDEREYERLIRPLTIRNELSWKRPLDVRVKNNESKSMKSVLSDESLPDDIKAKNYNQNLTRFLNTKSKLPESNNINLINLDAEQQQPSINDLLNIAAEPVKKKSKTTEVKIQNSPKRTRTRRRRKKKIFDDQWLEY